jgi:hypothetical protein
MAREENMKKNTLPKEFQTMLKSLERLDDELGISNPDKKYILKEKKKKDREHLLKRIWDNWPRKTFLNRDVLQMRGNALKNPKVKAILNKYHIGIEDCALVNCWEEKYRGSHWDCPADCSPESIRQHLAEWEWGNIHSLQNDYYWGGLKDPVKILFKQSNNNRFKVIGLIEIFPEKKAA